MSKSDNISPFQDLCGQAEAIRGAFEDFLLNYRVAAQMELPPDMYDLLENVADDGTFDRAMGIGEADARALLHEFVDNIFNRDYEAGVTPRGTIAMHMGGSSRNQAPIMRALGNTAGKLAAEVKATRRACPAHMGGNAVKSPERATVD